MLNYDSMSNESLTLFITSQLTMFAAVISATVALNHLWRSKWYDNLKKTTQNGEAYVGFLPPFWNGLFWLIDLESMALSVFFLINQWQETPGVHHQGEKALLMGFLLSAVGLKIFYFVNLSTFFSMVPAMIAICLSWACNVASFIIVMYLCSLDSPRNLEYDSAAPWFLLPQIIWGFYSGYIAIAMFTASQDLADDTDLSRQWDGQVSREQIQSQFNVYPQQPQVSSTVTPVSQAMHQHVITPTAMAATLPADTNKNRSGSKMVRY